MLMDWPSPLPESKYKFSDPIIVRKWPGDGVISVQVGYVREHPEKHCIYLYKRWKKSSNGYGEEKFYIKDGNDWLSIKTAIEKLWPELGELPSVSDIDEAIEKIGRETQLLELLAKYPDLLAKLPQDVNILALPEGQKEAFKKLLAAGGQIANTIISNLAEQPIEDLSQFVKLLEELKLSTINSLVTHVTSRIKFIDMFEKAIHNDDSYERRGDDSIHNLLKLNMWIINQNYSILHDDTTLKNIILAQWEKKLTADEHGNVRPDFLCMVDPIAEEEGKTRLVVIEIKRPSIKINLSHIGQVMEYRTILQKYSGRDIEDFKCYVIGREVDPQLQVNSFASSGFNVKTYTDFIREAKRFYKEYLKIIEVERLAF